MNTQSSNGCKGHKMPINSDNDVLTTFENCKYCKPSPEGWEVEYDSRFSEKGHEVENSHISYPHFDGTTLKKEIKNFIHQLLTADRERVVKERDDLWRGRVDTSTDRVYREALNDHECKDSRDCHYVSGKQQGVKELRDDLLSTEEITK